MITGILVALSHVLMYSLLLVRINLLVDYANLSRNECVAPFYAVEFKYWSNGMSR